MDRQKLLIEKTQEAINSILPIAGIVLALCLFFVPVSSGLMLAFLVGAALMVAGMGLFSVGAEFSMSRIGSHIGAKLTASRRLWLILALSLLLGTAITLAEPDLQVLAANVPSIEKTTLLLTVGFGVGLFLALSMLRILLAISLRTMLLISYALVFLLAFLIGPDMLSVAFDAGGVTTGPMTVPFIMALGLGVSAIRSDENAKADSFGLVALCSVGPILAVMLLTLIFGAEGGAYAATAFPAYPLTTLVGSGYLRALPGYLGEVALALAPIFCFFLLFQLVSLRLRRRAMMKILLGVAYTYAGLVLFLSGVNVGFSPLGEALGRAMVESGAAWALVPLSMLMGWFIIRAEPAVRLLTHQVEEITAGAISERAMEMSLSLAVASANGLAMLRVLTGVSILYFVVPGYLIALGLSFFVPPTFTGIAFDSGGVASGPLTASFMLLVAIGACSAHGGNVMSDAFGLVALVAMMPLITIQGMGAVFVIRSKQAEKRALADADELIELWEVA